MAELLDTGDAGQLCGWTLCEDGMRVFTTKMNSVMRLSLGLASYHNISERYNVL